MIILEKDQQGLRAARLGAGGENGRGKRGHEGKEEQAIPAGPWRHGALG